MADKVGLLTGEFGASELENSLPMDVGRRFRSAAGKALVDEVLAGMRHGEVRQRRRSEKAAERQIASVETLLANLIAAAFNAIDPDRFVGVSFDRNTYARCDLHADALAGCRDYLLRNDMITGTAGFNRIDADGIGSFGRTSRLRATDALRERLEDGGIGRNDLSMRDNQLIRLKQGGKTPPAVPLDVEDSRTFLKRFNQALANVEIEIPGQGFAHLASAILADEGEEADVRARLRKYAGDLTATSLYRVFNRDWAFGGRIYGGWWMGLSKELRAQITIDGHPTVELDYGSLHPRLLFHRVGLPMDGDPYVIPLAPGEAGRKLGKRTFNRLLNRLEIDPEKRLRLRAKDIDPEALPPKVKFAQYLAALIIHLAPIQEWFGTGEGLRLQKQDADLALAVLADLEAQGIPALPVHDSFLVASQHAEALRTAMRGKFLAMFGFEPIIS